MTNNGGCIKVANFLKIPSSSFWNSEVGNFASSKLHMKFNWKVSNYTIVVFDEILFNIILHMSIINHLILMFKKNLWPKIKLPIWLLPTFFTIIANSQLQIENASSFSISIFHKFQWYVKSSIWTSFTMCILVAKIQNMLGFQLPKLLPFGSVWNSFPLHSRMFMGVCLNVRTFSWHMPLVMSH
jgi:hypothetical protein